MVGAKDSSLDGENTQRRSGRFNRVGPPVILIFFLSKDARLWMATANECGARRRRKLFSTSNLFPSTEAMIVPPSKTSRRNHQRFFLWKRSKERDGGGVYEGGDGSGNEMNSTKEKRRSQAGFEPISDRIRRRDTEHGGIYEKKKERIEYSTLTGRVAFST